MPYIKQARREAVRTREVAAKTSGELNYQLTMIVKHYMHFHGLSYQTINDIVGALDGAKVEFQRRIAAPYEDQKIKENGDVYGA